MTVIMYLAALSQSRIVNVASLSSLRARMTRNLQLRGLVACTGGLIAGRGQLTAFYRPTPNQFNEEQPREYFLRLKNHKLLRVDFVGTDERRVEIEFIDLVRFRPDALGWYFRYRQAYSL